jgi:hypothetical protein
MMGRRSRNSQHASSGGGWYVVDTAVGAALRILPGLTVGETESGSLALNDRRPDRQWVRFDYDGDRRLWIEAAGDQWMLSDDGRTRHQRLPLESGVTLVLAHVRLCISDDMHAMPADGPTIDVVPAKPAHGQTPADDQPGRKRGRFRPVLLGAVAVMLGGFAVHLATSPLSVPTVPGVFMSEVAVPQLDPQPSAVAEVASRRHVAPPELEPVVLLVEAPTEGTDRGAAEEDWRLARARELMRHGDITYPPGSNAVELLTDVLEEAPDDQAAADLLRECSARLVDVAVAYHDRGLEYEARNTLEEVFSFHPEHAVAKRLWRQWLVEAR